MSNTNHLGITIMEPSQSQKHVTFNEAITQLDALLHLSVISRGLSTPPSSPTSGDRYLVASGGTGAWEGADGEIAVFQNIAWSIYTPKAGWVTYIEDEEVSIKRNGSVWAAGSQAAASSDNGGSTTLMAVEEHLENLTGPQVTTTIELPSRCIVFGISTLVTTAIGGATSFNCGDSGAPTRFGSGLSITSGSTDEGTIGADAPYTVATPIVITAVGGDFTSGAIRVCLRYIVLSPPST